MYPTPWAVPNSNPKATNTSPQASPANVVGTPASSADPSPTTLRKFWKRVAEVTSRYHDDNGQWTGSDEIRKWNATNRQVGLKSYAHAADVRKTSDRGKDEFLFDMTKDEFFPSRAQFTKIFKLKDPQTIRRCRQAESTFRNSFRSISGSRTDSGPARAESSAGPCCDTVEEVQSYKNENEDLKARIANQTSSLNAYREREIRLIEEQTAKAQQTNLLMEDIMRRSVELHEKTQRLKREVQSSESQTPELVVDLIVHEIYELWSLAERMHSGK
ncbi:hypothetical protein C8J57DRAFT_1706567 [Mycena rebaudengoi]|nr:hypothetical protein C8J57DRAFT_1706567 [Mycena rebaudengoi]